MARTATPRFSILLLLPFVLLYCGPTWRTTSSIKERHSCARVRTVQLKLSNDRVVIVQPRVRVDGGDCLWIRLSPEMKQAGYRMVAIEFGDATEKDPTYPTVVNLSADCTPDESSTTCSFRMENTRDGHDRRYRVQLRSPDGTLTYSTAALLGDDNCMPPLCGFSVVVEMSDVAAKE